MKKIILTLLATLATLGLALALLAPTLLGFSITQLGSAVNVATGMGAKLACSGRYVSGFSEAQNLKDLASYSPANRLLDLRYEDNPKRVTATLLGLGETSASYRPGLGCTLDIGDTSALERIAFAPPAANDAEWPAGSNAPHIDSKLQQKLDGLVASDNAAGLQTRALAVVQNGKLVAESYAEGIGAQTPLLGWSMGKSLTSMMIGRLQALQPEQPISQPLFPQWSDARADISLENLLQMSSGLDFDETYAPGSDATRMLFNAHSASGVALQSPLKYNPGEHFSYSSGTTNLLARWVYEQLGSSPQASADFFQQQILAPLGMRNTVFEVDASGVFVGSSYIYASARDWARLGLLMLNRGNWNGEQLLAESWVDAAQRPNHSSNDPRYGYQFWLNGGGDQLRFPELPQDSYFMLGNRQQVVMISPSTNTVIVRLGWTAGDYPTGENFAQLLP
ncbi:serine hydrolase domain-containing protein [Microbulbifer pacificus]|uniref:Serine hydrolase n=1 Tax=Microbulbifer pacificus TaxID=407164 RepID=A0AAU0N2G3_9GAMM|nr:serine hydrolase [Microbulbifer pacificus]WOX06112.1 serine hydrolase [Microbulbifer pacificus]